MVPVFIAQAVTLAKGTELEKDLAASLEEYKKASSK